jgi:hypothetical protein
MTDFIYYCLSKKPDIQVQAWLTILERTVPLTLKGALKALRCLLAHGVSAEDVLPVCLV